MSKQTEALKLALEALEKLWNIIDDIDTYGDMAKADEKLYRSLVERRQRTRFEETGISTDGYKLNGGAVTAIKEALAEQPAQQWNAGVPSLYPEPEPGVSIKATYEQPAQQQEPSEYVQKVIDALYENSDPVSVEAAELLEQMTQQQEPVAYVYEREIDGFGLRKDVKFLKPVEVGSDLYTSPPASKPWVGLTDVEWMNIVNKDHAWFGQRPEDVAHEVAKLVEAKLKEKNA